MGIQENVRRREAKLAAQAQAEMQATHEEQPQAAPSESKVQPMFDTSALRQSIRAEVREVVHAELQASRPEPFDMNAICEVIRTELHAIPQPSGGDEVALQQIVQGAVRTAWQTTRIEPPQVDMEAVRHVIRAEVQTALSAPVSVDIRMCRSAIHEELRDIHIALRLLTEAIQAQVQTGYDDDEDESQGESVEQDELLPTALSPLPGEDEDREERAFPAQESDEEDAAAPACIEPEQLVVQSPVRSESPIRRLQRPGPVGLDLGWGGPTL